MANMNLIGVFMTKLWPVQALACGGGGGGGGRDGGGGFTKNIIPPKFSNFGDIIILRSTVAYCGRFMEYCTTFPSICLCLALSYLKANMLLWHMVHYIQLIPYTGFNDSCLILTVNTKYISK